MKVELESNPIKLETILERSIKNKENREKRQLVTLAVWAAILKVSYYAVSQLTNMTGSHKNDVINNQNHVVAALQGEYNKLERKEADVNRLSKHKDDLEKHLLIMNALDTAFKKILSIKSQCDDVASNISNTEVALCDLLKDKLSPNIVNTEQSSGEHS